MKDTKMNMMLHFSPLNKYTEENPECNTDLTFSSQATDKMQVSFGERF
jgi:hypothetical protein